MIQINTGIAIVMILLVAGILLWAVLSKKRRDKQKKVNLHENLDGDMQTKQYDPTDEPNPKS